MSGQLVGTLFSQEGAQLVQQAGLGDVKSSAETDARDAATRARAASRTLQTLPPAQRVAVLHRVADALLEQQDAILAANAADVEAAEGRIAESLLQRLILKPSKLQQLADGAIACVGRVVLCALPCVRCPVCVALLFLVPLVLCCRTYHGNSHCSMHYH